jgi:hypothetical protein
MSSRIESELALLRTHYPNLVYLEAGHWVQIPAYRLPAGIWLRTEVDVCFQIPAGIPGEAPYGFYVPHLLLANGGSPNNYAYPATTPFGTDWGKFSWTLEPWSPNADVTSGSNMLNFARSFYERFKEGA